MIRTIPLREPVQKLIHDRATSFLIPIKNSDVILLVENMPSSKDIKEFAPCQVGDVLWLKETWGYDLGLPWHWKVEKYIYKTDLDKILVITHNWYSPVTMPREAVRWKFECTGIKPMRTQDYYNQTIDITKLDPEFMLKYQWAWLISIKREV